MERRTLLQGALVAPVALTLPSRAQAEYHGPPEDLELPVPSFDDLFTRLPKAYADHYSEGVSVVRALTTKGAVHFSIWWKDGQSEDWVCPNDRIPEAIDNSTFDFWSFRRGLKEAFHLALPEDTEGWVLRSLKATCDAEVERRRWTVVEPYTAATPALMFDLVEEAWTRGTPKEIHMHAIDYAHLRQYGRGVPGLNIGNCILQGVGKDWKGVLTGDVHGIEIWIRSEAVHPGVIQAVDSTGGVLGLALTQWPAISNQHNCPSHVPVEKWLENNIPSLKVTKEGGILRAHLRHSKRFNWGDRVYSYPT